MQKESKYTKRERLKRMGNIYQDHKEKDTQEYLDNNLIQAISNDSFWETLEDLIKEGANPNVKTKNGVTIFSGIDRIFSAWSEYRETNWSNQEGESRIKYLISVLDFIKDRSPEIDFDGDCNGHTLLEKVAMESRRENNFECFAPLFEKLLELGANPYSTKGFRQPIQWLKKIEQIPNHPMSPYIAEMEKELLNKVILEKNEIEQKNKRRM